MTLRPVKRGISPLGDISYTNYSDAKPDLIARISRGNSKGKHLGSYCNYCERRIETNLAIEHIQPKKGSFGKPELEGEWSNFLVACVNCNSTKGSKEVLLNTLLLPDRDNTFYAFKYKADGHIEPSNSLSSENENKANKTSAIPAGV